MSQLANRFALIIVPDCSWALQVFNEGDLHKYDELCSRYASQLNAQPALVAHERRLREKITLMSLVEMVASLPAEQRRITLADVGARTKLDADGAEFLLMKALSLHLIEGSIDQVRRVALLWLVGACAIALAKCGAAAAVL